MKKIENRKLFHKSNYHRRHYEIDFKGAAILVRKVHPTDWQFKSIPLSEVKGVTVTQEDELNSTIEKENELLKARNRSFLSRFRKDQNEQCVWNFAFELHLSDRTLQLHSNTRIDRDKWVHIWGLIADMNRDGVSTS